MIPTLLKLPNARKVVQLLGGCEPETELLILYDAMTAGNVEALMIAATEVGASPVTMQMMPSTFHGTELPKSVAAAMAASQLVIGATVRNIAHTDARRGAQAKGAKVIVLPESDDERFFLAKGWSVDFETVRQQIDTLAQALTEASTARVTSDLGTDVTMSIAGRTGRSLNGFANSVDISAGYCLEASLAPVEGTANGRIVVNASIPGVALIKDAPVEIEFRDGFAVSIRGGAEARQFRELLEGFNDPNVYNLGELGIGMNPMCTLDGTMLSDESVWGGFQLALGTSAYIGGTCKAAAHYDTVLTNAALELDGRLVFAGNRLLI
ncbi:leucyl aminopeptidase (aminopeptidase T) [Rhodoligotrophos appendicifer]|uniref:aminopeptidase n=1 Tax=Rhodoligotrophos appendicifer TaxID=987056 RepID=UPI0019615088|nr:hypothetical protein [Rhodoligotrophos appendicifer]